MQLNMGFCGCCFFWLWVKPPRNWWLTNPVTWPSFNSLARSKKNPLGKYGTNISSRSNSEGFRRLGFPNHTLKYIWIYMNHLEPFQFFTLPLSLSKGHFIVPSSCHHRTWDSAIKVVVGNPLWLLWYSDSTRNPLIDPNFIWKNWGSDPLDAQFQTLLLFSSYFRKW